MKKTLGKLILTILVTIMMVALPLQAFANTGNIPFAGEWPDAFVEGVDGEYAAETTEDITFFQGEAITFQSYEEVDVSSILTNASGADDIAEIKYFDEISNGNIIDIIQQEKAYDVNKTERAINGAVAVDFEAKDAALSKHGFSSESTGNQIAPMSYGNLPLNQQASFYMTSDGFVALYVTIPENGGKFHLFGANTSPGVKYDLHVLDAQGNILTSIYEFQNPPVNGSVSMSELMGLLPGGQYIIYITCAYGYYDPGALIYISVLFSNHIDKFELNDTYMSATTVSNSEVHNITIDVPTDRDWMKFTLPQNGSIELKYYSANANNRSNTTLTLYKDQGNGNLVPLTLQTSPKRQHVPAVNNETPFVINPMNINMYQNDVDIDAGTYYVLVQANGAEAVRNTVYSFGYNFANTSYLNKEYLLRSLDVNFYLVGDDVWINGRNIGPKENWRWTRQETGEYIASKFLQFSGLEASMRPKLVGVQPALSGIGRYSSTHYGIRDNCVVVQLGAIYETGNDIDLRDTCSIFSKNIYKYDNEGNRTGYEYYNKRLSANELNKYSDNYVVVDIMTGEIVDFLSTINTFYTSAYGHNESWAFNEY